MTRPFHIGTVLSVVGGRMVSPGGVVDIRRLLSHMTRDEIQTYQANDAAKECRPTLVARYPSLDSPEVLIETGKLTLMLETETGKNEPDKLLLGWLSGVSLMCGLPMELEVPCLPEHLCRKRDPVSEFSEALAGRPVLVLPFSN